MFADAAKVKDLKGVELVANWHINENNIDQVKDLSKKHNLAITMAVVNIFTQAKWSMGSFAAKNPAIRNQAIEEVKKIPEYYSSDRLRPDRSLVCT